jgi:hypothetical protein
MSFFTQGAVDTRSIDRSKLGEGTYRVRITDFADHIGANSGSRTQADFTVLAGPASIGLRKGHIVMHQHEKQWQADKARGEIASIIGAFMGLTREAAGFKVDAKVFGENSRTVQYINGGKDVGSVTRDSSELPLVKQGAEAILIVKPYFDKRTGQRKKNPKTGELSVTYEFFPLSCGFTADEPGTRSSVEESGEYAIPPSPETSAPSVDALELAMADGWKVNPNAPAFYYKKGEADQFKADALRAKYAGGGQ